MKTTKTKKLSKVGEWLMSDEPPLIDTSKMPEEDRIWFYKQLSLL